MQVVQKSSGRRTEHLERRRRRVLAVGETGRYQYQHQSQRNKGRATEDYKEIAVTAEWGKDVDAGPQDHG